MGMFSCTCAKTNLPVLANVSWPAPYCEVVCLARDGTVSRGQYDGYGNVGTDAGEDIEVFDEISAGRMKLVLAKFYNGESFRQLGKSVDDPGQGHFYDEESIKAWWAQGGFPDVKALYAAYRNPPDEAAKASRPILWLT